MGSKAEHPGCWNQASQGVAQATGGPGGWRGWWWSGVQQGQGQASEGQQGGEQGQALGRPAVVHDQGWRLQVVVGVRWAGLQSRQDWWAGLEVLLLWQGPVQGWGLGAGPSESSAPAGCDHCH